MNRKDTITLSQLYEGGVLVTGASGCGKTTSIGAHLCYNLLAAGCGMVAFCVKADEYARIKGMCDELGRECLRMGPGGDLKLDILDYSLKHKHGGIEQATSLLDQLIQVSSRNKGQSHGGDPYWEISAQRCLRMCITGTFYGNESCTIRDLYSFVSTLPPNREYMQSGKWLGTFSGKAMYKATQRTLSFQQQRDWDMASSYIDEWMETAEKTRSIIYSIVINILSAFMVGEVSDLIASGESTFTPEEIIDGGKVLVIDYPIIQNREPAQYLAIVIKTLFQRAVLRRLVTPETPPLVVWGDEHNWIVVPQADALALSVGRSARLITVAMVQSIPLIQRSFGSGEAAKDDCMGWMANFATRFIGANSDPMTNIYHERLLGDSRHFYFGASSNQGEYDLMSDLLGDLPKASVSISQHREPDFPAAHFSRQAKGGRSNNFLVGMVCYQNGRIFSNGKTFLPITIPQRF